MSDSELQNLRAVLEAAEPPLRLAMLFGSVGNGRDDEDSDLDIAVVAEHPLSAETRIRLIDQLGRSCGHPIDLIDLRTASVAIAKTAMTQGRVLFARDEGAYPEWLTRALVDAEDFLPLRDQLLEARRKAWIGASSPKS